MIAKSPELRLIYDDRAKEAKDRFSEIKDAEAKGREEGIERGKLVGRVQTLQEVVGDPVTDESTLADHDLEALRRLVTELRQRFGERR